MISSFDIIFIYFYNYVSSYRDSSVQSEASKKIIKIKLFWNSDMESCIKDTAI